MIKIYDLCANQNPNVTFSWKAKGDCGQKNYRIIVNDSDGNRFWDSGTVESSERHSIPCPAVLNPDTSYKWSVQVTDNCGSTDQQSGPGFFGGIKNWNAVWVKPARVRKPLKDKTTPTHDVIDQKDPALYLDPAVYMRKTIHLDEVPEKAFLYASARGIYSLYINGTCISDLLAPGFTSYRKRIEYQCHDVTGILKKGDNVIAAVLADGWYTGKIGAVGIGQQFGTENALIFQLNTLNKDGWDVFGSDKEVKFCESPWRYADLFVGSCYDASFEPEGWKTSDYNDSDWKSVIVCSYGYNELSLQTVAPTKEIRTITPKLFRDSEGNLILDAGEVITGYTGFCLNLAKGTRVSLEHSEVLDKDGRFMQNIVGQNKNQTDVFIAARDGIVNWKPEFTYHGFRYVRIDGIANAEASNFTIYVITTPMSKTAEFHCSDERLNHLHEAIVRSQQGNMISIPTDCPQREKTGWTGDMQVYAPTACFESDCEQFLRHWLADMRNEQLPDGQIPHIIPYIPSHDIMKPDFIDGVSAAGWSDACVILPWRLYEAYGDIEVLRENYPMMKKYMASVRQRTSIQPKRDPRTDEHLKYIWNNDFQYGDWLMPSAVRSGLKGPEMMMLTGFEAATLMCAYTNNLMNRICTVLGLSEEAMKYRTVYEKTCSAFMKEFANEDGTLKKDYQGLYVLALAFNVIPEKLRQNAVRKLENLIHKNDDRLDAGFLSIPFLLPVLHDNGLQDLAYLLLTQRKQPSWLYEIEHGATTLWESWDAVDEADNPGIYSMNHFAFGCVGEYLMKYIAGIRSISPGFKVIEINPFTECGLKEVSASYDSTLGKVEIYWTNQNGKKTLKTIIPPDCVANIHWKGKAITVGCGFYQFD